MDAKRTAQAEQWARAPATRAGTIDDLNSLFRAMMKSALESMLDAEMDAHLARPGDDAPLPFEPPGRQDQPPPNRRNGHPKKAVQGELGDIPRDRRGTFDPVLLGN
jgi:putative transposase